MTSIRKTLENREQAIEAIFASDVKNVRFGVYNADKKRVFWLVSATRFPQGFTLRMDRKAFAKKLPAREAIDKLMKTVDEQMAARGIGADLARYETWTDTDRASRLDAKAETPTEVAPTVVAPTVVTLSRPDAAELLGISRGALGKRIKRAGGELVLENGSVVS